MAVARALVRKPPLLVADEPTASLDDANAQTMLGLLLDAARRRGCTLVLASHDARVIQQLAERDDDAAEARMIRLAWRYLWSQPLTAGSTCC